MFLYSAWFRNAFADISEQDHEWVACFLVEAKSDKEASEWGNYLARKYSSSNYEEAFIKSDIEFLSNEEQIILSDQLPIVKYGHEASDLEIGW